MLKVHLDTSRLSVEELANVCRALRERCIDCVEAGVPGPCRHQAEVAAFLGEVAHAIDLERIARERHSAAMALGVEPDTGEWPAGA
jgi:hypothetical protein